MTHSNLLIKQLSVLRHRRFIIRLSEEVAKWLFFGTVVAGIFAVAARFVRMPFDVVYFAMLSSLVGVCVGLIKAVRNREDLLEVAQFIDRKFDLKERISTAFEIAADDTACAVEQLQMEDAKEAISSIDVYSFFPYKAPNFLKLIPISLTLIAVSFFIPKFYEIGTTPPSKFEQEAMRQTAKELEKIAPPSNLQAHKVIGKLRNKKSDVEAAQTELAKLHAVIHKRSVVLQSHLTAEIEQLAHQQDLPFEFRDKLAKALRSKRAIDMQSTIRNLQSVKASRLSSGNQQSDELRKSIEKIDERANEIARLNEMLKVIQNGQQRIGLASLSQPLANRNGNPGDESNRKQAVGTEVDSSETKGQSEKASVKPSKGNLRRVSQKAGSLENNENNPKSEIETTGNKNKLVLKGMESKSKNSSLVFAPNLSAKTGESFSQYRKVYLASMQELAEAISNGRIPIRYKEQVKDYFKGIAPKD